MPDHPKTQALVDEVVEASASRAQELGGAGQYAGAMAIYDAIAAGLPSARARIEADAQALVQAWIAQLRGAAEQAEAAGRVATASLYRTKITALDGQGQAERDALRTRVIDELSYRIVVKTKAKDVGAETVAGSSIGSAALALLTVERDATPASAGTLTVTLGKPKFNTDKQTRQASVEYQSGTKQVPNPFYKMAQDDVLDEERRLVERENEVTKQQQYVTQYSADVAREGDTPNVSTGAEQNLYNAENRLEAAQRAVVDQRNTLIRAKEKAASTTQTTEEAVYSTVNYTITTHQLTGSVQVEAKLEHADGRPALVIAQPLVVTAQDDAAGAQSVAGIGEDPLELPSKDELGGRLYAEAAPLVASLIDQSFAGHRQTLRGQASSATDAGEKLELLARYLMVDPSNAEPDVVTEILALSGVPEVRTLILDAYPRR